MKPYFTIKESYNLLTPLLWSINNTFSKPVTKVDITFSNKDGGLDTALANQTVARVLYGISPYYKASWNSSDYSQQMFASFDIGDLALLWGSFGDLPDMKFYFQQIFLTDPSRRRRRFIMHELGHFGEWFKGIKEGEDQDLTQIFKQCRVNFNVTLPSIAPGPLCDMWKKDYFFGIRRIMLNDEIGSKGSTRSESDN